VFPLSRFINFVFAVHNRGSHRSISSISRSAPLIPHSHQMMLFWAGLRGAVGVALAAGLQGKNAMALQTTVLITVVITMVVFGGTTTRMIEIVGVRVGVEEEGDDTTSEEEDLHNGWEEVTDEEGYRMIRSNMDGGRKPGDVRRKTGLGEVESGPNSPYFDSSQSHNMNNSVGTFERQQAASRLQAFGRSSKPSTPNFHNVHSSSELSLNSLDSDNEVLPDSMNTNGEGPSSSSQPGAVWRDGQWFTVLDEKFLLPTFSNATASRRQTLKKNMKRSSGLFFEGGSGSGMASPVERGSEEGGILSPRVMSPGPRDVWLAANSNSNHSGTNGGSLNYSRSRARASPNEHTLPSLPNSISTFLNSPNIVHSHQLPTPTIHNAPRSTPVSPLINSFTLSDEPVGTSKSN
jgi:solute carrier family 9 (sodium/hydrogen exchanger), member 6/7